MSAQPPAPVTRGSRHSAARRRVACYVVRETGDGRVTALPLDGVELAGHQEEFLGEV